MILCLKKDHVQWWGLIKYGIYENENQRKVLVVPTQALSGGEGVLAKMTGIFSFSWQNYLHDVQEYFKLP